MRTNRTKNQRPILRGVPLGLALTLVTSLLAACSEGADDGGGKRQVLRVGVLYSSAADESGQRQALTDDYELTHPDVDIELVSAIDMDDRRNEEMAGNRERPGAVRGAQGAADGR